MDLEEGADDESKGSHADGGDAEVMLATLDTKEDGDSDEHDDIILTGGKKSSWCQ